MWGYKQVDRLRLLAGLGPCEGLHVAVLVHSAVYVVVSEEPVMNQGPGRLGPDVYGFGLQGSGLCLGCHVFNEVDVPFSSW